MRNSITVELSADLLKKIDKIAKENEMTRSAVVRLCLANGSTMIAERIAALKPSMTILFPGNGRKKRV